MQQKNIAVLLALSLLVASAWAKLPPPSEEAKLKAAEAKAVAAANAKTAGEQLARAQDQVAGKYIKAQKAKGITVKPTPIVAPAPAAPATAAAPAVAAKK